MDFLSTPLPVSTGSEETVEKRYVPWNAGLGLGSPNKGKKWSAETRRKQVLVRKTYYNKGIPPRQDKYVYYTPAGGPFTRYEAMTANNCGKDALGSRCKRETFPDWYRVKKVDNT